MQLAALLTYSDPERSYQLLEDATQLDPHNIDAHLQFGAIADRFGKPDQAIAAHTKALKLAEAASNNQAKSAALDNLGNAYNSLGEYQKAIKHYQQALAIFAEIGSPHAARVRDNLKKLSPK